MPSVEGDHSVNGHETGSNSGGRRITYLFEIDFLLTFKEKNFYKLVQGFRVTCLFTRQYNTKGYDTITDVI